MIRWIVEGRLGTAPYSDDLRHEATVIDVRDLADRAGNDQDAVRGKIEEGIAALRSGARVVVACDMGISRSNAIAAGVLAKWQSKSLDWAIEETVARTSESAIKLDVIDTVRRAMFDADSAADPGSVLVTGATGFLGRNAVDGLRDKVALFTPGRAEFNLTGGATELARYCRDHKIGQLLHLAHPRVYTTNESLGQSLTILKNLIDVCRVLGIRLIFPSGAVVFSGYASAGRSVPPEMVQRPKGIYGETKYLQEMLVLTAVANQEIEATIVRVAPTYGPGGERPRLIRYFHKCLIEGKPIVTHLYNDDTPARLDLLYIEDTISGLQKVLGDRETPIHHLAPGSSYTPREIAERIAVELNKEPVFAQARIADDASNIFLDAAASKEKLKWEPAMGFEEGLRRTLAAFAE